MVLTLDDWVNYHSVLYLFSTLHWVKGHSRKWGRGTSKILFKLFPHSSYLSNARLENFNFNSLPPEPFQKVGQFTSADSCGHRRRRHRNSFGIPWHINVNYEDVLPFSYFFVSLDFFRKALLREKEKALPLNFYTDQQCKSTRNKLTPPLKTTK